MQTTNSIVIKAPREAIFETAANLQLWPKILPHYRYIHYYESSDTKNIVKMAALRDKIPISWVSEQVIDRKHMEVRFKHLRAFTKGMEVVWSFTPTREGVQVEIDHELNFRIPSLAPLADKIIGDFFIGYIATRTLNCMKRYLEAKHQPVPA